MSPFNWSSKSVCVTGAGGFIGSHLAETLVRTGANVRALVRYNSRNDWGLLELLDQDIRDAIDVRSGDVRDALLMKNSIRGCQVVFHLAALIAIPYSYSAPESFVDTNIRGTLNVLQACLDAQVERLTHTSTSEVYGTAQYVPIDERHPLKPQSPYAATKVGADKLAESFFDAFQVPVSIVRPFNTYGPRQSARAVIPTIITQALSGREIRLGNVDTVRDLTFVDDTVRGFIRNAETAQTLGETVNLGTGYGVTIRELVNHVGDILGKSLEVVTENARLRPERSEVYELVSHYGKARDLMGWEPQVELREGLKRTISWIDRHLDRYKVGLYAV